MILKRCGGMIRGHSVPQPVDSGIQFNSGNVN